MFVLCVRLQSVLSAPRGMGRWDERSYGSIRCGFRGWFLGDGRMDEQTHRASISV